MKKSILIIVSVVICLVLAAGSYFWVTGMIDSNYAFRSPIKDTPPAPGADLGEASTGRVVIVLIDGLRYDTSMKTATMPTLAQLRADGASTKMHSQPPSFSQPGYSTILTGAWPWLNDGPAFNLDYKDIPTWTQDNLFSAAHRAGLTTAVSGYYWFEKLIPQSDVDLSFYTPGEDQKADVEVIAAALPWLQNNQAQLVLIHIDQVDYAGHHEGGPKSIKWNQAAQRADSLLAQIVATLDFKKDTLLVISDHGQIDAGGHGGQDAVCLEEPFVLVGAGVTPGVYADVNMVDVAPSLAALLGVNIPASSQGVVRTDILNLDKSVLKNLNTAVESQQTTLLKTYAASINRTIDDKSIPTGSDVSKYQAVMDSLRSNKNNIERVPRGLIAIFLIALFIKWLTYNKKNGSIAWVIGGLVFAALFNFRYSMWDGRTYSLSSIISQTELITYVAVTSLIALVIVWLAIMLDQRYFKENPTNAAVRTFGLIFTVAFINFLPALLSFVVNGPVVTWDLPNYLISYLALLSLIQVLISSVSGLIFVGLNALLAKIVVNKNNRAR